MAKCKNNLSAWEADNTTLHTIIVNLQGDFINLKERLSHNGTHSKWKTKNP